MGAAVLWNKIPFAFVTTLMLCTVYTVSARYYFDDEINTTYRPKHNEEAAIAINNNKQHANNQTQETKFAPRFKHPSKLYRMHMLSAGRSIKLKCAAEGNPMPTIKWFKNNVHPITRQYNSPHYGKWSLRLEELTRADEGNYTCVVCNELQCINHTVYLRIQERIYRKPTITQGPANQTVDMGGTARFSCEVSTEMHPYIYWTYFDREEEESNLIESDNILTSQNLEDKPEVLTLYNVTKEDEGWYACVAVNALGNTTATGYLTVVESPNNSCICKVPTPNGA